MTTEFRDNDESYLRWVASHATGYVVNIQRGLNPSDARLHRTTCRTITGEPARGRTWTGPYIKVCAAGVQELDEWAVDHVGAPIRRCGTCLGGAPVGPAGTPNRRQRPGVAPGGAPPVAAGSFEVRGPHPDRPVIEAWIDDYIRFERRPPEQEALRTELRARLRQLEARRGEVLHAVYLGPKHAAADVENLALYYIDDTGRSFDSAAR